MLQDTSRRKINPQNEWKYLQIMSDMGLVPRIYKGHLIQKDQTIEKWTKDLNRNLQLQGRPKVKNNNNTMKRRSTSLVSYQGNANEKQNWYHFTPTSTARIKMSSNKCWWDVDKSEPSYVAGRNIEWCSGLAVLQEVEELHYLTQTFHS